MINSRLLRNALLASMITASMPSALTGMESKSWIDRVSTNNKVFVGIGTIALGIAGYMIYTQWNSSKNFAEKPAPKTNPPASISPHNLMPIPSVSPSLSSTPPGVVPAASVPSWDRKGEQENASPLPPKDNKPYLHTSAPIPQLQEVHQVIPGNSHNANIPPVPLPINPPAPAHPAQDQKKGFEQSAPLWHGEILLKNQSQRTTIAVDSTTTIARIEEKIRHEQSIPYDVQIIFTHKGKVLLCHQKLTDCSIIPDETIYFSLKPQDAVDPKKLYIKTLTGYTYTIDFDPDLSIRAVKNKIKSRYIEQELSYKQQPLGHYREISDYGIRGGDTLHILFIDRPIDLYVSTLDKGTCIIKCRSSDLVRTIKEKICNNLGIACDQQRLIGGGKQWKDDNKTLAEMNPEEYSYRIHLVNKNLIKQMYLRKEHVVPSIFFPDNA